MKHTRLSRSRSKSHRDRRRPRFETLENRRVLATLGIDITFLADDQGAPGTELQEPILRGEPFWVDVRVEDIRTATSQGVIALPLNMSWDPSLFGFLSNSNLTAQGNASLPLNDSLVTSQFPLQRSVDSFDAVAGPFDGGADPNTLLDFFNLRGVRGAALPNLGSGQPIGAGASETFSLMRFTADANSSAAPVTVNLDGSMSFADADQLDDVIAIGNASDVTALENTVTASIPIIGGTISGTKFDDLDGDGVRDAGEAGLAGVTIQLTGAVNDSQVTDANGDYSFDDLPGGTYSLSEVIPTNSLNTFPANNLHSVTLSQGNAVAEDMDFGNFDLASLSGTKFDDANGNGARDTGEMGIAGITIQLDLGNNGTVDATTLTGSDGSFLFNNVVPGTHLITEVVPAGSVQTLPASGGYMVTATSGLNRADLDFGNSEVTFVVSGIKFDDLDGDGARDAGEAGRSGITIQLDIDNNGTVDNQVTTGSDGSFQFNVPPGTHSIREVVPAGSTATTSASRVITVDQSAVTDVDFGNFQLTTLGGVVFNDLDRDGIQDAGEVGFANTTVRLSDGSQQTTDADGNYQFDGVGPGTFTITADVPAGFSPTIPANSQRVVDNQSGMSRTDLDFGNAEIAQSSSVSGLVYVDVDRDGQFEANEFGMPSVTVQLFRDGEATPVSTITAADGSYHFADLEPGTYRIVELQPDRFVDASSTLGTVLPSGESRGSTDGLNAFDAITLGEGESAIDYNFGEVLAAVTKRMFLASTNVAVELNLNLGLQTTAIAGTNGDDQIRVERLADSSVRVTVNNNTPINVPADEADIVRIDALGGQDSVVLVGNGEDETARVSPSHAALITSSHSIGIFNAPEIRIEGGGGNDTAVLRDSAGSDQLTASGNSALLESPGNQQAELIGFSSVEAISAVDTDEDRVLLEAIDYALTLSGDWI